MKKKSEITDEFINNTIAKGKPYCIRLYKAGPDRDQSPEEEEKIQTEHLRYLMKLRAEGILLVSGPVIDDFILKGIGIFNTSESEVVKKLCDEDPAVKAGRLVYEIYHWFGFPGDCLPE
ncbi:MAG: hypothetical protein HGGPFJEG_02476 [Ignavibacteria bacterium]|nr:hypothetical protein [Ignavibacteria bacterium]